MLNVHNKPNNKEKNSLIPTGTYFGIPSVEGNPLPRSGYCMCRVCDSQNKPDFFKAEQKLHKLSACFLFQFLLKGWSYNIFKYNY